MSRRMRMAPLGGGRSLQNFGRQEHMSGSRTLIPCCDTRTVGSLMEAFSHIFEAHIGGMRPPFNEAVETDGGNRSTISRPCQATDCSTSAWLSTKEKVPQWRQHWMHHERRSSAFGCVTSRVRAVQSAFALAQARRACESSFLVWHFDDINTSQWTSHCTKHKMVVS